jgi:NadR type nicotinamide-nucleotide adenylyltransferase
MWPGEERRWMLKKIAITGPESTGKTWLAEQLARYYKAHFVKEYAREYLARLQKPYTLDDIVQIAKGQLAAEKTMEAKSDQLLFADTEMLVCKIWADFVFRETPAFIQQVFEQQHYDLYLLCDIDLPWEADPLREHPDRRKEIMLLYIQALERRKLPYKLVSGLGDERLKQAIAYVDELLLNNLLTKAL